MTCRTSALQRTSGRSLDLAPEQTGRQGTAHSHLLSYKPLLGTACTADHLLAEQSLGDMCHIGWLAQREVSLPGKCHKRGTLFQRRRYQLDTRHIAQTVQCLRTSPMDILCRPLAHLSHAQVGTAPIARPLATKQWFPQRHPVRTSALAFRTKSAGPSQQIVQLL